MANKFFGATSHIGGNDGDLDKIAEAGLTDGDGALVIDETNNKVYTYTLDASNASAEDAVDFTVIVPDDEAASPGKRWLLVSVKSVNLEATGTLTVAGATTLTGALLVNNTIGSTGNITAQSGSDSVIIKPAGAIELLKQGGSAFIDFKNDSAEDFDFRLTSSNTNFKIQAASSESLISMNTGSTVQLFYDNLLSLSTSAAGANVYDTSGAQPTFGLLDDAGTVLTQVLNVAGNTIIQSYTHGSSISLKSEDTPAGDTTSLFHGDPDGAVTLYNDGSAVFNTHSQGISFNQAGQSAQVDLLYNGTEVKIVSEYEGEPIRITAENAAGDAKSLFHGNPDGATTFYYTGTVALDTNAAGISVYDNSGDDPAITLRDDAGASRCVVRSSGDEMQLANVAHGGAVRIQGENAAAGDVKTLFIADPDGGAILYYQGTGVVTTGGGNSFIPVTDSATSLGVGSFCWSAIHSDAAVTICSDEKYKKSVQKATLGLDFINDLVPVVYKYKKTGKRPKNHNRPFQGFLANEVEAVLNDHGHTYADFGGLREDFDEDGERWLGLQYEQLLPPMVKAIQELTTELERVKGAINGI
jgi:hypothetical protein